MHVGEAARAMNIAREYGERLDMVTDNLRGAGSLSQLIADYPSYGFVIDRVEAKSLFRRVRNLTERERALCAALGTLSRSQSPRTPHIYFLSEPPPATKAADHDKQGQDRADPAGQEPGAAGAHAAAQPAQAAQPAVAEVIPLNPTGTGGNTGSG